MVDASDALATVALGVAATAVASIALSGTNAGRRARERVGGSVRTTVSQAPPPVTKDPIQRDEKQEQQPSKPATVKERIKRQNQFLQDTFSTDANTGVSDTFSRDLSEPGGAISSIESDFSV